MSPRPTDHPFTDEDRARLDKTKRDLSEANDWLLPSQNDDDVARSIRAALAYIDRLEGALREIVDLGPAVTTEGVGNAAAIARAALEPAPTPTPEEPHDRS